MPILPHDDSLTAQDHFLASVGISFSLQAYLHNVPAEFTRGITIWAASLCKYSEGKEVRIKVIPSIIPRPEELVEHENAIECVFVGMTLSYGRIRDMAAAKDQAEQAGTKRKKEKGLAALDLEGDVEVIATDPEALRVVAKKSGRTATFYALANPNERSLCMGIVVPGEDVFFFEAVRDDSVTSYQGRKDSFARKIRDLMAGRLTSAPAEANGCKRRKVKNEKNELAWSSAVRDFIEREPTMLVAKATVMNLVSLLENSLITGNIGGVHLSLQILRDLGNKPKEAVTAGCFLGAFVAPRQAGPAVSEHVFSLLKLLVPNLFDVHGVTIEELQVTLEVMRNRETALRHDQIEPYMAAFVAELRAHYEDETLGSMSPSKLRRCALKGEMAVEHADEVVDGSPENANEAVAEPENGTERGIDNGGANA